MRYFNEFLAFWRNTAAFRDPLSLLLERDKNKSPGNREFFEWYSKVVYEEAEDAIVRLQTAYIFELDKDSAYLLSPDVSRSKIRLDRLPFPLTFINIKVPIRKGLECRGFFLREGKVEVEKGFPEILIDTLVRDRAFELDRWAILLYQSRISLDTHELPRVKEMSPKLREWVGPRLFQIYDAVKGAPEVDPPVGKKDVQLVRTFIMNFLNFLNDPEIKYVDVCRDLVKARERISRGKFTKPPSTRVICPGRLVIYADQIRSGRHFKYSHSFPVRGHWRRLDSDYFTEVRRGTSVWIPDYVKGEGLFIKKSYELKKKLPEEIAKRELTDRFGIDDMLMDPGKADRVGWDVPTYKKSKRRKP